MHASLRGCPSRERREDLGTQARHKPSDRPSRGGPGAMATTSTPGSRGRTDRAGSQLMQDESRGGGEPIAHSRCMIVVTALLAGKVTTSGHISTGSGEPWALCSSENDRRAAGGVYGRVCVASDGGVTSVARGDMGGSTDPVGPYVRGITGGPEAHDLAGACPGTDQRMVIHWAGWRAG